MKTQFRKTTAWLLALAMLITMLPGFTLTASAADTDTGKAIQLVDSGTAANISGGQVSNVYFGNYYQSDANGQTKDPIKWRVLSNADGKLFLLSDQNLDVYCYHKSGGTITWENSGIRSWLNGGSVNDGSGYTHATDNFLDTAFSASEQTAIADTTVVNNDNASYGTDGGNNTTDKVFLLSIEEAQNTAYGFTNNTDNTDTRKATNTAYVAGGGKIKSGNMYGVGEADWWWLRSPGNSTNYAAMVSASGSVYVGGHYVNNIYQVVRPAFNINLSSVLFTSAAEGGKPEAFGVVAAYSGTDWKLTLKDDSRSSFSSSVESAVRTSTKVLSVTINYSGAATGANEYISAMICDADGNVTYYGRLKNVANTADVNGTVEIDLSGVTMNATDTLYIFNEQYNGDYKTDYASELKAATIPSEVNAYYVTFEANSGTGTMDSVIVMAGGTYTLPVCTFTVPMGYDEFKAWSVGGTEYAVGNEITIAADTTVKALWTPQELTGTVTITGDMQVGSTLTATVTETNNTGTLSYQWYRYVENSTAITGATQATYTLTADDVTYGIFCEVSSSVQTGNIDGYASGTVKRKPISISSADKSVTYDGSTYDVSQMFTIDQNAGAASYTIVSGGTGAGTLNGSMLTITKAGTIKIKLTTAADGAYAAGEATATLTVNKGAGSGTVTIEGWTYGEDAKAPVVNSSTNGTAGVTYLYESTDGKGYTGSVAPENAGSYKLTVTFAETDLYADCTADVIFTIEQKELSPAISGSVTKVYDNSNVVPKNNSLAIVLNGIVDNDNVTATASYAYDSVNVGTTKINATGITLSGADASNYKLTATTASANVGTITQATPAYTVPTGLTATYGDMLADIALPEGFTWEAAPTTAVGNVGNREFTVTYTPGDTLNYKTVTGIKVSIEVKAAAASVATAPTAISGLIYNEAAQALITVGAANGGEMQYSLSKDSGYSTTIPTGTDADTYTVWYKIVGDSNHSDTAPVSIEIKIGKADPAIGAVIAGVVNDTLEISAIVLNRADTTVDGVLTVDAGQVLKLGDNEIAYTFTPADTDNYEKVNGKVTVTVKDTVAPSGKVTLGANSWNEFLNDITFGLFFKETQTVSVEASDSFSGVEKVEYYATSEVLNLDSVKALADDKWTVMAGSVNVTAEDAKQFIYYIRITDNAGNVTYLSTDGAEYDTTAPVIDGVHNGVTYYTTQKVTVTDRNLDTVTLNGETVIDKNLDTVMLNSEPVIDKNLDTVTLNSEDVTDIITLEGDKETTYAIVATDKAGNTTTVTVTMKLTESVGAPLDGITEENVTSDDKENIQDVIYQIDALLADEDLTEGEEAVLEEIKEEAEMLIRRIRSVTEATNTENTEKVEDVTAETVTPENKNDLENAKADLEKALEENGGNYTDDEKKAIEDEIKRIDEALTVIENVEAIEDKINKLPENITKDNTDDVDAAKKAYDELSDYEKTLIDPVVKAKLDAAVKAAEEANKPAGTNSPATGDTTSLWLWFALLFVSGGAVITLTVYDRKKRS